MIIITIIINKFCHYLVCKPFIKTKTSLSRINKQYYKTNAICPAVHVYWFINNSQRKKTKQKKQANWTPSPPLFSPLYWRLTDDSTLFSRGERRLDATALDRITLNLLALVFCGFNYHCKEDQPLPLSYFVYQYQHCYFLWLECLPLWLGTLLLIFCGIWSLIT